MSNNKEARGFGRRQGQDSSPIIKSYFLGIGINKYDHFRPLNNAVKDVQDVAAILIEQYDVDSENVILLKDEEATRENIIHALDKLSEEVGPDDKLIIYFSGHGLLRKSSDRGFWIPVDAQKRKTAQYIRNNTVLEYVEDINSRHTLLIADACFSGSLLDAKSGDDNLAMQEYERYRSRWILCSGRSDEMVSDGKPGQNSPFTQSILQVLKRNADSKLNIGKLADKVTTLTRNKDQQMPVAGPLRFAGDENGQYVFTKIKSEDSIWGRIKQENTKAAYESYLIDFPNGKYIDEALAAIDTIKDDEAWADALYDDDIAGYTKYLRRFRKGKHRKEAKERIEALRQSYEPSPPPKPKPNPYLENMVFVKGGSFQMGSEKLSSEQPVHTVHLSDFYIGKYPVTFEQYDAFCAATGKKKPDDEGWGRGKRPVMSVSWYDAIAYCNWLSEQAGLTLYYNIDKTQKDPNNKSEYDDRKWLISINEGANGFRLPTEAQWEYAARGGNQSKGYLYAGSDDLKTVAWYGENSGGKTQEVGLKQANELGLYDMSGNVWEWCWDWYGDYGSSTQRNPIGASSGSHRVSRGGGWYSLARYCRVAFAAGSTPAAASATWVFGSFFPSQLVVMAYTFELHFGSPTRLGSS